MNNDTDCMHEKAALDVEDASPTRCAAAVPRRSSCSATAAVASLTALAHAELGIGDGWVGLAAHPGEGVCMTHGHRSAPSPTSAIRSRSVPELDMYNPDNGWRPWPEP